MNGLERFYGLMSMELTVEPKLYFFFLNELNQVIVLVDPQYNDQFTGTYLMKTVCSLEVATNIKQTIQNGIDSLMDKYEEKLTSLIQTHNELVHDYNDLVQKTNPQVNTKTNKDLN